jgi:malate dehydrogenase (oxaloacetate-decarboxylating)(NADP+)
MNQNEKILHYHLGGKIALKIAKKLTCQKDLAIAYTPGVADVCKAIEKDPDKMWELTSKGNCVAVITDGTAVLGLGNIGVKASLPVMEGKAILFKMFADINAWPILVDTPKDIEKFVTIVKSMASSFGGINLEDIAAPHCFEIEKKLQEELDIPVFHDDQWGTAIIVLAALTNCALITSKPFNKLSVVINGAGAAGLRIAEMLKQAGITNLTLCDKEGVISKQRKDLCGLKTQFAINTPCTTIKEVIKDKDVLVGVSAPNCITGDMIASMADYPIIFALANPIPEIMPQEVAKWMKNRKYIMATGRSDFPNQINNVLGFPFIFRGALDVRASKITLNMKISAAKELARIAQDPYIPKEVIKAYKRDFAFGPNYFIPTIFDPRLKENVSKAVSCAAIKDHVNRICK